MITKYVLDASHSLVVSTSELTAVTWIDLYNPTLDERNEIRNSLGIELPNHADIHQIEYSHRFNYRSGYFFFCVDLVTKTTPIPENHVINLIISNEKLITIRYTEIPFFMSTQFEQDQGSFTAGHYDVFIYFLKKILGNSADIFEIVGENAEDVNRVLIGDYPLNKQHEQRLNRTLKKINYLRNLISKAHHSLSSLNLLIAFLKESPHDINSGFLSHLEILRIDIRALMQHSDHLTQKMEFQLQSTLGLINIEQTQIIKVFTVLAMIFMPPTLIASIYGMNFKVIPELSFVYGYPLCLLLMIASSLLPYRFFKKKGWI